MTGELCIQETEFDTSGKLEVIAVVEKIILTVFVSPGHALICPLGFRSSFWPIQFR